MPPENSVAERVRRRLLEDISSGALPPGSRLGNERELAEEHRVSRSSLRQALEALEAAGLIRRRAGRGGGTFVAYPKIDRGLDEVSGFPAYLARQGHVAGTRVMTTAILAASPTARQALNLDPGALTIAIQRLRLADGLPFSLDYAQFPLDRFPDLLERPLGGSLYSLLRDEYGVEVTNSVESVEVVQARSMEAANLMTEEGDPLVSIVRTTYDSGGVPFEFSSDLIRADRVRITMRSAGAGMREPTAGGQESFATVLALPDDDSRSTRATRRDGVSA